ncbi:hypothetical protein FOPG_03914 [Fusarium oxysporum f. sp. conglutinans race 2 54008]|jgi:hypothetical protein|uniref:Uncharacterized protein n=6 Tax=Fusarium oxysporum TaxID=5507 RepID=A0A0J9WP32_FUSO4|nr:hypothetical protein FOXG_20017 [Fusarium oxysporum f. sp. lycopersici 4287]EXA38559.1 hypothetical protein FOVG_10458 [Fusarium oxysporum f. sp. pisi HDV247]EXK37249.1 hypothetical protein FOMG_08070 [Fusarium oxysporum f. sp. melonis 26406]EXL83347.1 hypothetical protein FOPG_03914 [Fusarium oxysporum f. sp. conglutinans race 2 54008]EXM31357.1 hypothetical protein FOTG_04092 [Fusarium oxysporum f. sp. vasinfectum 25433]KAI8405032.1 hypothetical protein FOFC_14511 [Fusarium oxysporum]
MNLNQSQGDQHGFVLRTAISGGPGPGPGETNKGEDTIHINPLDIERVLKG